MMRWLYYMFLGIFSLGLLGIIVGVVGIVGIVSYYSRDLPDYAQLKVYEPPVTTRVHAGDGRLLDEFSQQNRVFVPIDVIPYQLKNAFIAAEDQNFYDHKGVDLFAIARAMLTNVKNVGSGKRPIGASTITQQVAKNFLLSNEVSYERKIKEAILAYRMEEALSKDRLLELYLNEIYLGGGAYGVAAASMRYFDKSLEQLEIDEMAYLAALPKAPNNYHPVRNHDAAFSRRNWVIDRMADEGFIAQAQADIFKLRPLEMIEHENTQIPAPYFAEEIRRELEDRYGRDGLYGGGLSVRSTVNPKMQQIAVNTLRDGLMAYDKRHGWRGASGYIENLSGSDWAWELDEIAAPRGMLKAWSLSVVLGVSEEVATIGFKDGSKGEILLKDLSWAREALDKGYLGEQVTSVHQVLRKGDVVMVEPTSESSSQYKLQQIPLIQGAIVAMDPHTGRVLAMQGGWNYSGSEFNRATQAKRQPGSAFKPFVYLSALDNGFTPATLVLDAPFVMEQGPGLGKWSPSNYSNVYYGPTPIRVGIEKSKNLMTVRLADFIGMDTISEYARNFGVDDNMPRLLANALGSGETTLIRLTTAYGMLVNGGKRITPTFIDRIQDRRGDTIYRHDARPCPDCGNRVRWMDQVVPEVPDTRAQIADPKTVYQVVSMLEGVVQRGTGIRIRSLGRPLAGKTGTTNESRDAWFMGFSPDLVVGVYAGFDDPKSLGRKETGSSVAVPIFKSFMKEALEGKPATPFRVPAGIRHVQINAENGARAKPGDERVIWEAFVNGTEPTDKIYILDGKGISLMPAVSGSLDDAATTGTGGLY